MLCAGGLWALARAAAEALRDLGGLEVREHLGKVRGGHTWGSEGASGGDQGAGAPRQFWEGQGKLGVQEHLGKLRALKVKKGL